MRPLVLRHAVLCHLLLRGAVVYGLLRVTVGAVGAGLQRSGGTSLDNPVGLVLLTATLCAIDIRRRGETLLWANLGYGRIATGIIFALVAAVGEILIAVVHS